MELNKIFSSANQLKKVVLKTFEEFDDKSYLKDTWHPERKAKIVVTPAQLCFLLLSYLLSISYTY